MVWLLMALSLVPLARADDPAIRFISDQTAVTLRLDKGMDSPVAGLLTAGTRVQLLEADTASGYSRVRVAPGREGWVLARYLSMQPAAREQLVQVQAQLGEQQALVRKLQAENAKLRETPAAIAVGAAAARTNQTAASANMAPPQASTQPEALITGAGLLLIGLLLGLLIPLVLAAPGRGRKKNWSQL